MSQTINDMILAVVDILYKPYFVPLILLAAGVYFTIRTRFMQLTLFKQACKAIMDKPQQKDGISSFGALMVSTASRVGTGNIIGVSTAICLGGPGAVFWMWITAVLGGATAFVESTLAQIYKKRRADGTSMGGPAYYMEQALGARWLGVIFSGIIILIYALGYNLLASYNLQSTFEVFSFYHANTTPILIGIVLAILFGIIVIGGARRLIKVTEVVVPVMGILYVLVSLIVMAVNYRNLPGMFRMIFEGAFDFQSVLGGFSGSCIMWGIRRGLYSNEAGMGSAPNASAKADVSHPAKQGLVQMISVFIDTLLICTASAFMCLCSGVVPTEKLAGAAYVQESIKATLGEFGPVFMAVAMSLFAFTTLIGNYSYCEGCLEFILKRESRKAELIVFRVLATGIIFFGAISKADLVWNLADLLQGLAVVANVPVLLLSGGTAIKCLNDYAEQIKKGHKPHFSKAAIGLLHDTDYWNDTSSVLENAKEVE
ncbi:MAG: alanine/glycine:cation symporter family protein [Eubacteriales bacterium]|nr:alanine/glycine:cation symporter family protein [Eubacteriales bacterium]